jgi:hypothetical protein
LRAEPAVGGVTLTVDADRAAQVLLEATVGNLVRCE